MEYTIKEDKGYKYIDEGNGEVLLLLHGLMGALSNWGETIEQFKGNYRIIIPMLPIYDMPIISTGVKSLSKWLEKFVNHLDLKDFVLIGNSLGGHLALMYVVQHQDKVKAMVLAGSSGLYENSFGGSFPRRESYDFIKERVEFTFYDPKTATKELVDEVYDTVNNKERVIKTIAMAKSAIRHNMSKELANITIPVGLIWGKNDKITPPEVAEEFCAKLPNASLSWIDKCGHAPMMEQPVQFNQQLRDYLNSLN